MNPTFFYFRQRPGLLPAVFITLLLWGLPSWAAAQGVGPDLGGGKMKDRADAKDNKAAKRDKKADADTAQASAADAEARQLAKLRDRLEVEDDAEWDVIARRITQVIEARRTLATGSGDRTKRTARTSGNPDYDALRSSVSDKLTDAEIKARLARVHQIYQQNEALLAKAQADLRAVLSIRQEAVAVMVGLLPP